MTLALSLLAVEEQGNRGKLLTKVVIPLSSSPMLPLKFALVVAPRIPRQTLAPRLTMEGLRQTTLPVAVVALLAILLLAATAALAAMGVLAQARRAVVGAVLLVGILNTNFLKTRLLGTSIGMAAAVVVELASLDLAPMEQAEHQTALAAAVVLAGHLAGVLAVISPAQMAAHMVAVVDKVEMSMCLVHGLTIPVAMAQSALSVSSGVLAVAIRRTPQTSN